MRNSVKLAVGLLAGGGGRSYSAEATALFAAMSVQPDAARKALYNTLIESLKTAGVWSKLDLLYIVAAHDAQAARLNAKSPGTFVATVSGSPTFQTDRGYTGAGGGSGEIDTGFVPATHGVNYQLNSAALFAWSRTSGQEGAAARPIGGFLGSPQVYISPRGNLDTCIASINNAGNFSVANADGAGFYIIKRTASGASQLRKNLAELTTNAGASTGLPASALAFAGCAGTSADSVKQTAIFGVAAGLSNSESDALYNALNTYLVAVGAA